MVRCIATTGTGTRQKKETGCVDPPVQYNHHRRTPVQSSPSYRVQQWRCPDRADRLIEGMKHGIIAKDDVYRPKVLVCSNTPRLRGAMGTETPE